MTRVEGEGRPGAGIAEVPAAGVGPALALASRRVGEWVVELARRMAEFELLCDVVADPDRGPRVARVVVDRAEDARRRLVELEDQVLETLGRLQTSADPRRGQAGPAGSRATGETASGTFFDAFDAAMTSGVALIHALHGAGDALVPLAQGLVTDPNLLENATPTLLDVQRRTAVATLAATGLLADLKVAEVAAASQAWPQSGCA